MWNLRARPSNYLALNVYIIVLVSFYMLPALLARASVQGLWRKPWMVLTGLLGTAVFLLLVFRNIPLPLRPDQTWSLREVGASRALIDGGIQARGLGWAGMPFRAVTLVSTTLLAIVLFGRRGPLAACVAFARLALAECGITRRTEPLRVWAIGRAPLLMYVAVYLVLTNLLWMYHDRYYLVIVPPLLALTLAARPGGDYYPRSACLALVLFGALALAGTSDALRFNQAVRESWESLVDAGIPPSRIDAGYAWNGWTLYAHPANLGSGQTPFRDVPWVTSDRRSEYVIATKRLAGYSVWREVTWRGLPWPGPDRLFVLRLTDGHNPSVDTGGANQLRD
jgi:hypothetical protein